VVKIIDFLDGMRCEVMDIKYKTFINPCKLYARIKGKEVIHLNGFKVELDTIVLYYRSSVAGYKEENFMLEDIEIFEG